MFSSITRFLCRHKETHTRRSGDRMYTKCVRCGDESEGITFGGHQYSNETLALLARTEEMRKARQA